MSERLNQPLMAAEAQAHLAALPDSREAEFGVDAGEGWRVVATSHAHGAWVRPGGPEGLDSAMLEDAYRLRL